MFIRLKGSDRTGMLVNINKILAVDHVGDHRMTKIFLENDMEMETPETIDEIQEKIYKEL